MSKTNLAIGDQINLAEVLNKKLETGVLQTELALESAGALTGQAVRYDEFVNEHTSVGAHKSGFISDTHVNSNAGIQATKLLIQQNYKKTTAVIPSATAVTLAPPTGYKMVQPLGLDIVFGGTFNSETVTVTITITYGDTSSSTQTFTATATGTTSLTNTQLMSFIKDGTYITQISAVAKSSIASTTATVTLNRYGFFL